MRTRRPSAPTLRRARRLGLRRIEDPMQNPNTVWSNLRKLVVTFRAGLPGSCVLPRRPLPPSRVPRLTPVFFNTTTSLPRVLSSVSIR